MRSDRPFLLVSGILALVSAAYAQSSPAATPALPTFKTGATDVLVDVVVTGHHGNPVEGLSQDNFSVLENGQPQQIVSFTSHPSATPLFWCSSQPFPGSGY